MIYILWYNSGYCVKTGTKESQETLEIWSHEINNYEMPSGTNKEDDDQKYLKQEIEIDAIAFAHWLIKKEFDLKTYIPEMIKEDVLTKVIRYNKT